MDLAVACYRVTNDLQPSEKFGLVTQLRRASTYIAANIAEGNGRTSRNDYLRFLDIAHGSLHEVETLIELAQRVGYLSGPHTGEIRTLCRQVGPMLGRLRASLTQKSRPKVPALR